MILPNAKFGSWVFWVGLALTWAAMGALYYGQVVVPDAEVWALTIAGRDVEVLAPGNLALLLVLPLLVALQRFGLSDLPRYQQLLNLALRMAVLIAIVSALVQVVLTSFESRVSTVVLVDTSASMPDGALSQARAYINQLHAARGEKNDVQVVGFARRPYVVPLDREKGLAKLDRPPAPEDALGTDLAAALRLAYGLFPQDHVKRVVLLSDGNQTLGDLLAEVPRARDFGVRLFHHALGIEAQPEVMIQGVEVPESVQPGSPFLLVVRVFSNHAVQGRVSLWQNAFSEGSQDVELIAGENTVEFRTTVHEAGFRTFRVELSVDGADTQSANNRYVHSMTVRGKPRVLYLEGELRARHYLERALREQNLDMESRGPNGVPTSLEELRQFDLVIMSDVAARYVTTEQMALLETYVREHGGGFIMAGGEFSFGSGGYQNTPMEKLLPVSFDAQRKRETPSMALMLVIDKSGSMNGDRMELAKDAAKATVEVLQPHDRVGVTAFDHDIQPVVRLQPASNRVRILSDISRIQPSGGTNIAKALAHAYDQLIMAPARIKHVILLSDGISNPENIFTEIVPSLRIENITVSSVAIGEASETPMLRRIAEGANGRFYYTNNPYSIPRIFVQETHTVSRSQLVEEPFVPRIVKRSQALDGIPWERAPYLLGYVSTKAKPQAEVFMVSEHGEPVLARWRVGMGKSVAFTSDLKNRWGVEWVRWPGYAKFWSQLIRDTMRSDDRNILPMRAHLEQDQAVLVVDAIGEDDMFINDLASEVTVTSPSGVPSRVRLEQTAAGRYEGRVPLEAFGAYGLSAEHLRDSETVAISQASVSYPYPAEFLFVEPNFELLERAAAMSGGRSQASITEIFDPMGERVKYRRELWPYSVALALLLLLLDLALRRIRLSGKTELSWEQFVRPRHPTTPS